jgi:hypothetical protein
MPRPGDDTQNKCSACAYRAPPENLERHALADDVRGEQQRDRQAVTSCTPSITRQRKWRRS